MGTRSAIIVKVGNHYEGIYCHWDGYPEGPNGVGYQLYHNYASQERAEALVALGDLSTLKENLAPPEGEIHTYDNPYRVDRNDNAARSNVTVASIRDRGETSPDYLTKKGKTIKAVADAICDYAHCYVFSNGEWKVDGKKLSKFQAPK